MSSEEVLSAVKKLVEIGDDRAVESLSLALRKDNIKLRFEAAKALGKVGTTKAVGALMDILKIKGQYKLQSWRDSEDVWSPDSVAEAREEIIKALIKIGDSRARKALKKEIRYYEERRRVASFARHRS